jgi:hypothetical protein
MRRFTVMGFTEAELGFVLAAVFAALSVSALNERATPRDLAAENRKLTAERDSVARAFAAFRDSAKKRSNKVPRCSEKGESPAPVAELRILGRNLYELQGERLPIADVSAAAIIEFGNFRDTLADQLLDDLHATGRAVVEKCDVNVKLRSNRQQTLADLMADLRHLGVVASVAEEDQ